MRHVIAMLCLGLLAAPLEAAESVEEEAPRMPSPAVGTSPEPDAPQVGRGNPRRVEPGPAGQAERTAAATADRPAAAPARGNADRIELEATQITGNAELPRVMYVVPWKRPELGELGGRPARSLLDEVLEPVDRDVFRRQNRYYEALRPDAARGGQ
ncbi:MAG: hypothetical protein DIU62_000845 [Pseudomonadota bacterium]|jgi:hypothetical protein